MENKKHRIVIEEIIGEEKDKYDNDREKTRKVYEQVVSNLNVELLVKSINEKRDN